jgi:hypothetical protein
MLFAPSVECYTWAHWLMVSLSVVYLVAVIAGLPIWIWVSLQHHIKHGTLHNIETERRWGFVHENYEAGWKWWEVVFLARRLLLALISVNVPEPMMQGAATLVMLAGMLGAQVFTAPFIRADTDVLDVISISASMCYCLAGMLMYPSVTEQSQGRLCSEGSDSEFCQNENTVKDLVSTVAMLAVVFTLLVSAALTVRSVRESRASGLASKKIRKGLQNLSRAESFRAVRESTNRVPLDQVLDGQRLLKWTNRISKEKHFLQFKHSAQHYLVGTAALLPRAALALASEW